MRPTTSDIAKEAGVSLATVDRVLNERPGVRAPTIEKVKRAIDRLGYVRDVSAANLARQRTYRLVFVVPDGGNEFHTAIRNTITECSVTAIAERTDLQLEQAPLHDPHALAKVLNNLDTKQIDGVAILATETPLVRDAIRHLKESGVAVVALISDLPNTDRDYFVGINNIAAGRTAGELLGRFAGKEPGKLMVVASSMQSHDSAERRLGFDHVIHNAFPQLEVLPTMESHDDLDKITHMVSRSFRHNDDIRGVYSLGAGSRMLTRCLAELAPQPRPLVIAHELTPHTENALKNGSIDAVITQDLGHIIRSSLRLLRATSDQMEIIASQERIRIEIIMKENLY